jgi:hypothetical protein
MGDLPKKFVTMEKIKTTNSRQANRKSDMFINTKAILIMEKED